MTSNEELVEHLVKTIDKQVKEYDRLVNNIREYIKDGNYEGIIDLVKER